MDLVAEAKLPIGFDDLREALAQFIAFIRKHCVSDGASAINVFLHETGCKTTRLLAEAFPSDYKAFGTDPILDRRRLLSKSDFVIQVDNSPPSDCACDATLTDFLASEQALAVVAKLAATLPPSGRGIMLQVHVRRMKLLGVPETVHADLTFSKWRSGSRRKETTIRVSCPAQNKSDLEARQTLRGVAERLSLNFSKPSLQPPLGLGSERPTAEALFVAQKAFQAAYDLALYDIEEKRITLDSTPLLFPRFEASRKRMDDMQRGISDQIDVVAALKRLVRERQAEYEFEASDAECIIFRKSLTASLDGVLTFERFHNQGLGKSFTVNYGVQFPRNPELQANPVVQVFRDSLFTLFHRNWEQLAWAYSTGKELEQILTGCEDLLSEVLPLLEKRLVEMLSPLSGELPRSQQFLGALTAKEAYARALSVAEGWAEDVELVSVGSLIFPGPSIDTGVLREVLGSAIGHDGRMQPHGWWSVSFVSKQRGTHLLVAVPHTGAMRWSTFGYPAKGWRPATVASADWLDSTAIAAAASSEIQPHLNGNQYRLAECLYRLGAHPPKFANIVWEITAMLQGKGRYESRQVHMEFDPWTGKLQESRTQP